MTAKAKLTNGRTLKYEVPATGSGWTTGTIGAVVVKVYIRPEANGGGVFVDYGNGLVEGSTGEETVWFNNRLWTRTEEEKEMEQIKEDADGN